MKNIKLSGGLELNLTPEQEKELRKQLVQESKVWKPEINQYYYSIDDYGGLACNNWYDDEIDNFRLSIGNCFENLDAAKQALKTGWAAKLQARKRLDDYIAEKGYDTDVDWSDTGIKKYFIAYKYDVETFDYEVCWGNKNSDLPHFVYLEDVKDVIANCGDDLKLLLGVEK